MADWLTPRQRSHNMASIRSIGNRTTEKAFVRLLRAARVSGWRRHVRLTGNPDFVFRADRVAVFVDGCFWHGCPACYRLPDDHRDYWQSKVAGNRRRDKRAARQLRRDGWKVLRVWEHALKSEGGRFRALRRLLAALSK
jgi:DNA mismatch endonuclease (patch repair protein)